MFCTTSSGVKEFNEKYDTSYPHNNNKDEKVMPVFLVAEVEDDEEERVDTEDD